MNILIQTLGSRGDVQPYVALGKHLQAAGHTVTLCTSCSFESFITAHGLNYAYMNDDFIELARSDDGRMLMESLTNAWEVMKATRRMQKKVAPMQYRMLDDMWTAAQQTSPDLIIYHPKAFGASHYAEKLGIRAIMALVIPMFVPTGEFPAPGFPQWKLGKAYNRMTCWLVGKLFTTSTRKYVRKWRVENGMTPQPRGVSMLQMTDGTPIPVLHGFSKHVIPEPIDWPDTATVNGYWFLDQLETWEPPAELEQFLAAGDPPVYVGFGSMARRDAGPLTELVISALQQAKVRGLLAAGWGGLAPSKEGLPDTIFAIDKAPHDWLFPRMSAVIHHGGAGTTAAGIRAGKPTLICPFFGDQPFWGSRVHDLGVGAKPIPQRKLTVENLAAAMRKIVSDQLMRERAATLGERLRAEKIEISV